MTIESRVQIYSLNSATPGIPERYLHDNHRRSHGAAKKINQIEMLHSECKKDATHKRIKDIYYSLRPIKNFILFLIGLPQKFAHPSLTK